MLERSRSAEHTDSVIRVGQTQSIDLFDHQSRMIEFEPCRRATYVGNGRWEISLHVRGRAPRPDGVLMTVDILERLPAGSFERDQALRLVHKFDGP
jgi:hypothetical protein